MAIKTSAEAYPTCKTCKHWTADARWGVYGVCSEIGMHLDISVDDCGQVEQIETDADFGCIKHAVAEPERLAGEES